MFIASSSIHKWYLGDDVGIIDGHRHDQNLDIAGWNVPKGPLTRVSGARMVGLNDRQPQLD